MVRTHASRVVLNHPSCAVNEFVSPRKALPNGHNVAIPSMGQSSGMYVTPPSRAPTPTGRPDYPSDVSPKVLSKWQETAAMIISNRSAGDQQALMSLGEVLSANAWFKAAHVW